MNFYKNHNTVSKLTDDLLIEILSRLPVKSILQCKCVSKTWHALISDSRYRKKFPQTISGLFYHARTSGPRGWSYSAEYLSLQTLDDGNNSVDTNLSFLPCGCYKIVDCCNGLLLCESWEGDSPIRYVCNPARKRWVELPKPDYEYYPLALHFDPHISRHYIVLGFKVESSDISEVPVSFPSEICRWVEKWVPWRCGLDACISQHVFLNGSFHLLAFREHFVAAIDVEREIYRKIELPVAKMEVNIWNVCVGQSQGFLHYAQTCDDEMIVWVFNNYDENEWSLKHSISLEALFLKQDIGAVPSSSHQPSSLIFQILAFHPDLDVLFLLIHAKLFAYHLVSTKLTEICIPYGDTRRFYAYTPCLLEDMDL